jgi:hypothetical protein
MKMRPSVDLYWLPLGAGGHSVRLNGRVFEAVVARVEKRPAKDLYHSALIVNVPEGEFVIEQAPVVSGNGAMRGVVAEGAVGTRWARSLRIFRYEIRRWRGGVIPDAGEAVDSPQRLTDDVFLARRVLELVPDVPTPVWGRDELQAGEMWNSNSLISWLIARSGLDVDSPQLPAQGRAPGWDAGLVVARRQESAHHAMSRPDLVPMLTTDSDRTWVPRSVRSSRGYGWLSLWPLLRKRLLVPRAYRTPRKPYCSASSGCAVSGSGA